MPYHIKPGRSLTSEFRRIGAKQLALAADELRTVGDPKSDDAVHEARRHVKKARAILRLVRPALGDAFYPSDRRLRRVIQMLASIADSEALLDTVERLRTVSTDRVSRQTIAALRSALLKREARIGEKAQLDRVLPKAASLSRAEARRLAIVTLNASGFRAVAAGLERSVRRARKAAVRAGREPTTRRYHDWRCRVKDLWLHVRLLQRCCGGQLATEERRLEALDDCLGEYHNVVLLEQILKTEALVSRQQTAHSMRLLRRYQAGLRRRAAVLGRVLSEEKPRHFVRRVKRLWQTATRQPPAGSRTRWPSAA